MALQTILGSGGAIGRDLAKELKTYTGQIRLVARNPTQVNAGDELFKADLLNRDQVIKAVKGSEVVYLTVGLQYQLSVWKRDWPVLMRNVLDACMAHGSRLVFIDNVYMIGGDQVNHLTESSPFSPVSEKGKIREQLNRMILDAVEKQQLNAIIARSADFYGPGIHTSMLLELVYKNLLKGKKPQWLGRADKVHSFTYTPDAAKGAAILGNTPDAYNQIWNLPTDAGRTTIQDWVNLFVAQMGGSSKVQVIPVFMMKLLGLFIPVMRELPEMLYQYDRDYFFDSNKFCKRFNYTPVSPDKGVAEIIRFSTKS